MSRQPGIKVTDIAYARVGAPDLDVMEQFLVDFGLTRVARTDNKLYMRGAGPAHHIYIAEQGDPNFIGFAYYARNAEDLERAAQLPGAISGVEKIDEPGGGSRVRFREPNGYQIEIVYGIEEVAPMDVYQQPLNTAAEPLRRKGDLLRIPNGPLPVMRIAHGVLVTPKFTETLKWFRDNFGFLSSDDVYAGSEDNVIASFNRCDCGDDYVDHHAFAMANVGDLKGLHHISFEVADIDSVMANHYYLKKLDRYEPLFGVGRHNLGSQVYDYWSDPWGRVHEHWADSDRLNASSGSGLVPADEMESQWGDPQPETFLTKVTP